MRISNRIGNRISGLSMIAFGGIMSSSGAIPLILAGGGFIAEGIGDAISGDHHYLTSKLLKSLSRQGDYNLK